MLLTKQYFPQFYVFHVFHRLYFLTFYFENDSDIIILTEVVLTHY